MKNKTYLEILEEFMENNKSDYAKNLWIRKEISDISILLGNYGLSELRERFLEKITLKYNVIKNSSDCKCDDDEDEEFEEEFNEACDYILNSDLVLSLGPELAKFLYDERKRGK